MDGFKRYEMDITFGEVNPELLKVLAGCEDLPVPEYRVEIFSPIKLKWWERLLRRPQLWHTIYIPNATLTQGEDD